MAVDRSFLVLSAPLIAAVLVAACAGSGPQMPQLSLPTPAPVAATPTPAPASPENAVLIDGPVGSATDLYARLASGAMSCWFGTSGPLKQEYIFHATADAPSRGGKAQIVIHRRDPTQPNPRGAKAYRISIDPTGETTATIKTENLKMSEPFASAMTHDVGRWAKGEQGCAESSAVVGWVPAPPAAEAPVPTTKTKKAKTKTPRTTGATR